eukprot:153574-Chlamydomonas_euryale.AAC.1
MAHTHSPTPIAATANAASATPAVDVPLLPPRPFAGSAPSGAAHSGGCMSAHGVATRADPAGAKGSIAAHSAALAAEPPGCATQHARPPLAAAHAASARAPSAPAGDGYAASAAPGPSAAAHAVAASLKGVAGGST